MSAPYAPMTVDRLLTAQLLPLTPMEIDLELAARSRVTDSPMARPLPFIATVTNSLPILEQSVAVAREALLGLAISFAAELDFPQQQEDEPGLTEAARISRAKSYLNELNDYMSKARELCISPVPYVDEKIKQETREYIETRLAQMLTVSYTISLFLAIPFRSLCRSKHERRDA